MNRPKIIIAGGSGFLGRSLARTLNAQEYEVVILSRTPLPEDVPARWVKWDGKTVAPEWACELEGARAVVNLTGKNVNCRYTEAARKEIDESRVDSVWAVAAAINACEKAPAVWVQAGSLAIYGDGGETKCDETTAPGQGIPVETCLKWEKAFAEAPTPRTRKVLYRISFVLGHGGGALQMLVNLTRCFLGGAIGNGRQYISWIHEEDMNRLWQRAIEDPAMNGTYNATSNDPVPNATFMKELRRALRRPWTPPLPAWLVPLGCWMLRTEPVLALTGRRGVPARLLAEGFQFHHPELRPALTQLFRQG
ncbi:MAG TPA: TIGR01777 family oxidoreductase [Verrucomicrobium sp.]|nr:TIGR01777 family oxidoreductase [Verrucomicrobium sp.]